MKRFTVPFHVRSTELYEVEAANGYEAASKAGALRQAGTPPTHQHETGRQIGKPFPTIEEETSGTATPDDHAPSAD